MTKRIAVVLVGNNPASKIYVGRKSAACKEAGFFTKTIQLPEKTKEREVNALIRAMDEISCKQGLIITQSASDVIKVDNKEILVVPAFEWFLQYKK